MKKILYTHVLILLTLFCSCDLLDIKPVNSMLPVSVEDFESVLLGGYPRSDFFINTDLATDNVYANLNATSAVTKSYEPWFIWAATHQYNGAEDGTGNSCISLYFMPTRCWMNLPGKHLLPKRRICLKR